MVQAEQEKIVQIKTFLQSHAEAIYTTARTKQASSLDANEKKELKIPKDQAIRVVTSLANNVENREQGTFIFGQLGEDIAKQCISHALTLEEAIDSIIMLKQTIGKELEQAASLYALTISEFSSLSSLMTTYCDCITSRIALAYHNHYNEAVTNNSYAATLTRNIIDAVISTDNDYKIVSWNKGAEVLYGWSEKEVQGRYAVEVLRTELLDTPANTKYVQEAVAQQGLWKGEALQTKKDGSQIAVLAFVSVVKDAKGNAIGTVAVNRDITERIHRQRDNVLLATLSEQIRMSSDPDELVINITRLTGEYLVATRCYLAEFIEHEDLLLIGRDYSATLPSIAGAYPLSSYNTDVLRMVMEGRTRVSDDTHNDPLTTGQYKTSYEPLHIHAFITVPCRRTGHTVATMTVSTDTPRTWQTREILLVETIAERLWNGLEKLRNEQALRESEERFRTMADNIQNLAWMAKPDGYIYWYNKRWYDYTGTTPKDMEGWGWQSVHNPDTLSHVVERWSASLQTGLPFNMTFPLRGADGVFRPFLTRVMPVKNEAGEVVHWFGTNTDISEQIQAEEALRLSKEKYETLFKSIDEGFCIIECLFDEYNMPLDYLFVESNAAFERYTGLQNSTGKTILELVPDIEYSWIKTYGTIALTGEATHFENHVGAWNKWFDVYAFSTGKPEEHRVAILFDDITDRKHAEESLRKLSDQQEVTLALLESLLKNAPIGFAFLDREHRYIRVNESLAQLNGIAVEDHIGKTIEELLPENAKTVVPVLDGVMQTQEPVLDLEVIGETPLEPGITRYWLTGFYPVFIGKSTEVNFVGAVVIEITAMKKLEHQKDEFLAVASHELKTPVTSIKAYTQVLQKLFKNKGDTQSVEFLTKMEGQINKLIALIADLLDVSKIEAGKLQLRLKDFDFEELVAEIIDEIQRTTTHHIIHAKLTESTITYGDRDRIGQVITNLLTNAVKYSPDADRVLVKTHTDGDLITLSVQDFGLGIPLQKQVKVFERFYRVEGGKENTYAGLGLGLYISSEIITRHGGSIWVESVEGEGSTFYFSLPTQQRFLPQPDDSLEEEVIKHE